MRSWRSKAVAGTTAALMILTANIALADSLEGDELAQIRENGSLALGTVCAGESASGTLNLAIRKQSRGNTYANGATVTVSPLSASTGLTAGSASGSISIPSNWENADNGTLSPSVTATVSLLTSTVGPFTGSVTYRSSGLDTKPAERTFDEIVPVTANVVDCAPADSTPPVITPTVDGTLGQNGWYTSDVTLTWSVTDAESAISSQTGCDDVNVTSDQQSVTYTCSATSAGGTATERVSIKRDATPPVITDDGPSTSPNGAGWYNTDVVDEFSASDAFSGLAAGTSPFTRTTTGEGTSVSVSSGSVSDLAGNTNDGISSAAFKIDKTAPTSVVAGVTEGAIYGVAPRVTCPASDELSGPKADGTPTGNSTGAGAQSVTCNGASDNADNVQTVASPAVNYTLAPIGGFNSNFDGGAVLKVKPNQAIPLKWAFNDGTTNLALLSGATMTSVSSTRCTVAEGTDGSEIATELAAGASGLQLLTDNSYQMNWKATSTTGCRALTVHMTFKEGGSTSKTILVNIAK